MTDEELILWAADVLPQWKIGNGWVAPIFPQRQHWSVANTIFLSNQDNNDPTPFGTTILSKHLLQRYIAETPEPAETYMVDMGETGSYTAPSHEHYLWGKNERTIRTAFAEGPLAVIRAIYETGVL